MIMSMNGFKLQGLSIAHLGLKVLFKNVYKTPDLLAGYKIKIDNASIISPAYLPLLRLHTVNPSNAEAMFVQRTRKPRFLIAI